MAIRFFDEDENGESTRTQDMLNPECDRCGERLYGGSHYHCGQCTSTDVTSMLGHYVNGRMTCKERGGNVIE
jgi:ribosomal protein S27AE